MVADADVLAADLLVGDPARAALDVIRAHSWLDLIASDRLLADGRAVIETLADPSLAAAWQRRIEREATLVEPTLAGHPALTAAAAGEAATVLSFDETLRSAQAGAAIRPRVATSVKSPDAFRRLVDPSDLYETLTGEPYPGPDRDPRG